MFMLSILFQKARYDEDLPPTPSPPQIKRDIVNLDGVNKEASLERVTRRSSSIDREQLLKDDYKTVSCFSKQLLLVNKGGQSFSPTCCFVHMISAGVVCAPTWLPELESLGDYNTFTCQKPLVRKLPHI